MIDKNELEKLKIAALNAHIPIIMDDTLERIKEILEIEKPNRILEIGTAVGYSASKFAEYTENECIIDTIEIDEERANEAIENVKKIGVADRINIMIGNAVEILPTLKNDEYDIIFIDAAKGKYPIFLEESIKLIKDNGLILADNVLYKGYVMSDYNLHKQRTAVRHLREYIKEITENENYETEILDIGDGLSITRVHK
ncbi:MAG: O-methyltransferase [Clostridia bacterium]|nr:O-methyltransferase [Clostridia bacterium]